LGRAKNAAIVIGFCKLRIDFYGTGEVGDRPLFVP